jgi:hypothetical protein
MFMVLGGGMLACGGSGGGETKTNGNPGTTAGTYTLTITGTSGTTVEMGTVKVTVQ